MNTSKYNDDRRTAKRVTRHPAYQALRLRALKAEKDALNWRRESRRLARKLNDLRRGLSNADILDGQPEP